MISLLIRRNIWRNKRRTLITMASVTFAVVLAITMRSLQNGIFEKLVDDLVGYHTGYLQVHSLGYQEEQSLDNSMPNDKDLLASVTQSANVSAAVPRIESFMLSASGTTTRGCLLVGTVPEDERRMSGLDKRLVAGAYFRNDVREVLIAEKLASKLQLIPGDTLVLLGQGYQGSTAAGKFPVRGVVHFGTPALNESLVFMPLTACQELLGTGDRITALAVNLDNPSLLVLTQQNLASTAGSTHEVVSWKEMLPDIDNHIRSDSANFYLFFGVLYILIAFGMFGTVLMMLNERKYELGILLAIGMSRIRIAFMLVGETILIALTGALAGVVIGFPLVLYLVNYPIHFKGSAAEAYSRFGFDPVWPASLDYNVFLVQTLIVLVIALLVSVYPCIAVCRLQAVKSIRR